MSCSNHTVAEGHDNGMVTYSNSFVSHQPLAVHFGGDQDKFILTATTRLQMFKNTSLCADPEYVTQ